MKPKAGDFISSSADNQTFYCRTCGDVFGRKLSALQHVVSKHFKELKKTAKVQVDQETHTYDSQYFFFGRF